MKIQLDENNYITAFAIIGDIDDSIEADLTIEDFKDIPTFCYQYINEQLILDEAKKKEWEESLIGPELEPENNNYVTWGELAKAIQEGVNSYGL